MKYEWRKQEKNFYIPKTKPEVLNIPAFRFFSITGKGNPNDDFFADYIGVLYSVAYAVRMSPKAGLAPINYFEYTVYPLEGIWDINEEAKKNYTGELNKNDLVFNLMIRQPDFVTNEFAQEIIEITKKKKPHDLLEKVRFETIEDGKCVQMLHIGSYDKEAISFRHMERYCDENKLIRKTKEHREIYLTDVRKVPEEKLKTVLRFRVERCQ